MTRDEFQKLQYEALREEILATQRRNLQTLGFGALSIPAASYFAEINKVPALSLTVPLLVIGIALFYLADNHAITRCGEYIRNYIEAELCKDGFIGWETWLEAGKKNGTRRTEHYTTLCFYFLFLIYFIGAVYLAWRYMRPNLGFNFALGITITYCVFGALVGGYIVYSLRWGTAWYERVKLPCPPDQA